MRREGNMIAWSCHGLFVANKCKWTKSFCTGTSWSVCIARVINIVFRTNWSINMGNPRRIDSCSTEDRVFTSKSCQVPYLQEHRLIDHRHGLTFRAVWPWGKNVLVCLLCWRVKGTGKMQYTAGPWWTKTENRKGIIIVLQIENTKNDRVYFLKTFISRRKLNQETGKSTDTTSEAKHLYFL